MQKEVLNPEKKNFNEPDETQNLPNSKVKTIKIGDKTIKKQTFQPGWRWSKDWKPIVKTEWCQNFHTGVLLSGKLHILFQDGKEMNILPNDAVLIPPGHDAWVVGKEPTVLISFE